MQVEDISSQGYVWHPPAGAFDASPVGRFARRHGIDDLANLAARADADPEWFWGAVADDLGLRWRRPFDHVLDLSRGPEWPTFFAGGRLNITESALDRWVEAGHGDRPALCWHRESGPPEQLSYGALAAAVSRAAGGLRALGVARGDVVAILLPMCPEAVISLLAIARLGAIAMPLFSGYGAGAVRRRIEGASARVVVTIDGFDRRGKTINLKSVADEAVRDVGCLASVVVVRRAGLDANMTPGRDIWWDDLCAGHSDHFAAVDCGVDEPMLLLYTSGSTGNPKGCVHTHAGLPIKVAQEARYGLGVDEHARILWLTDMGWVMGPWLTFAALLNGATAILFEGVPDWPSPDELWRVASVSRASVVGVAPTVVRSLMAHGAEFASCHPLDDLRAIGSTGEPWNVEPWWWCFEHVGRGITPIVNICGGTECGGSILSGSTVVPLKPCGFAGPALGMAADVVGTNGRSIRDEVGELVVRFPWPGMTRGFWDEPPARYLDSYWTRWSGVWHHGDFAYVDKDGVWYVLGRSDDTIKVAGKRLGPAEVESTLTRDPDVVEAAAVGVPDDVKGETLVCFVVSAAEEAGDLRERLAEAIERDFGKALSPSAVHVVSGLPKTKNGKVMRRVIRAAYAGTNPGDLSALDNDEILGEYGQLAPRPVVAEERRP